MASFHSHKIHKKAYMFASLTTDLNFIQNVKPFGPLASLCGLCTESPVGQNTKMGCFMLGKDYNYMLGGFFFTHTHTHTEKQAHPRKPQTQPSMCPPSSSGEDLFPCVRPQVISCTTILLNSINSRLIFCPFSFTFEMT